MQVVKGCVQYQELSQEISVTLRNGKELGVRRAVNYIEELQAVGCRGVSFVHPVLSSIDAFYRVRATTTHTYTYNSIQFVANLYLV